MGVRILNGTADGTSPGAALYDSVTGVMLGHIIEGVDAYDQAEAFLQWFGTSEYVGAVAELATAELRLASVGPDPRSWPTGALGKLFAKWRAIHVDADGFLRPADQPEGEAV